MTNLIFDEGEVFGSEEWKRRMLANGEILKSNNVRHILLVHGTFAGYDAFGFAVFDLLNPIEQRLTGSTRITEKLKSQGKRLFDKLAKDIGNYTPEYAEAFNNALNHEITCQRLVWSSGNFHLARLKGAIYLAQELAATITENKILASERILLLGHSHAGQLFALLTTFLENGQKAQQLNEIIKNNTSLGTIDQLLSNIEKIKTVDLDIVTFGTPVRYAWGEYTKYRLMAIVNHRSPVNITGLLSTRDGDYVQQWGSEGTDFPPSLVERGLNDQLDAILDKGRDVSALKNSLGHKNRQHPHYANGEIVSKPFSQTFLVDYKDNASSLPSFLRSLLLSLGIPHCVKTLFGHGVYTEMRAMLFNTDMIVDNFYSKKSG